MRIAHDFASPCQLKALRPHIRAGSLRAAAEIPLVCNRRAPKLTWLVWVRWHGSCRCQNCYPEYDGTTVRFTRILPFDTSLSAGLTPDRAACGLG